MNGAHIAISAGAALLTVLGAVMATTNPSQVAYEAYATKQLTAYLETKVCSEAPTTFGLRDECRSLLRSNQSQIKKIIADSTQRQNFIFFSVYTTRFSADAIAPNFSISVGSFLPSYRVQTVGAFHRFHVYETAQE
ncbi:MAG: DUF4359 domain-containing protein [Leptolyngbyaceae cyanobacterium RU_5_1]|nr:DUF4359 domain-containing protein [Leptolyngbyaceae cyanobacterium RU_5_1]